jgi:hypothetical protein
VDTGSREEKRVKQEASLAFHSSVVPKEMAYRSIGNIDKAFGVTQCLGQQGEF